MIAPDHDWRLDFAGRHQRVKRQPGPRALAIAQPADTRGQPLKLDVALRQPDPARQVLVLRKQLQNRLVGAVDVRRVAGERHPAEWPLTLAEQWADIRRN